MTDYSELIAEARLYGPFEGSLIKRLVDALEAATRARETPDNFWTPMSDPPPDGAEVLTLMKHGIISGFYDASEQACRGYYWRDMEWIPHAWAPMPSFPKRKEEPQP